MSLSLVAAANGTSVDIPAFHSILGSNGHQTLLSSASRADVVRDQLIAREGDVLDELLIVAGGVLKLWKAMPDGRRQIVAFRLDGDVVSMHGNRAPWPTTVQAVTAGSVLRISWQAVHDAADRDSSIKDLLLDLARDEVASLQGHLLSLGRRTTEEKLASFLLHVCRPSTLQNPLNREHRLQMRRSDIADYLGLTTESVSREFSRLKRARVISMPKPSRIVVLDRVALEVIAAGSAIPELETAGRASTG